MDWLVGPWSIEAARRAVDADDIFTCELPGFTRAPKAKPWQPYSLLVAESQRIASRGYHAAVIARPDHWWGALLAHAARIPHRFGYAFPECAPFLTTALPPLPRHHATDQGSRLAAEVARAMGGKPTPIRARPSFHVEPAERQAARSLLASLSDGRPLVAIHPGSGADLKAWPNRSWHEVVATLTSRGLGIVLTGSPAEAVVNKSLCDPHGRQVLDLSGQTPLGALAAIYERCALVIGVDSGPLHMAAAVGTPTVRIYGPTDVAEFGPLGDPTLHRALAANLPCQPCGYLFAAPCGALTTPACMRAVSPLEVLAAAQGILDRAVNATPAC
ncbi:MAG: glycosyltransferase family 9 protein [Chloroflexota bacterium]